MKNFQKTIDKNHKKRYHKSGGTAHAVFPHFVSQKNTIQVSINLPFKKGGESHDIV